MGLATLRDTCDRDPDMLRITDVVHIYFVDLRLCICLIYKKNFTLSFYISKMAYSSDLGRRWRGTSRKITSTIYDVLAFYMALF